MQNRNEYAKNWQRKHKNRIVKGLVLKEYNKVYREKNKEYLQQHQKNYREKNREKIRKIDREYSRQYRLENREKTLKHKKEHYQKNREIMKERNRKNYLSNIAGYKAKNKNYYLKNKDKILKSNARWVQEQRQKNPSFVITLRLRSALRHAFELYANGERKRWKASKYGVDYKKITKHLLVSCPPLNELSNYHIHHIKPVCYFDFTNPEDIVEAFSPKNLMWLPAKENIRRGARWDF